MLETEAAGFWSYAHEDDLLDQGTLLRLATLLEQEFSLLTGSPLNLFVDRNSLKWGEEWRRRIEAALAETTFFIPLITPRYFTRAECRRELLSFTAQAKSLGLDKLVLPILYVPVPGLAEDSDDKAVALVARTQFVDWTDLRLVDQSSAQYRRAVNSLAARLVEIAQQVTDMQVRQDLAPNDKVPEEGVGELLAKINELMPEWSETVIGDWTIWRQLDAVLEVYRRRLDKLGRAGQPASAILATHLRLGGDILPLAERFAQDRKVYLARSIELDPLIVSLGRTLRNHPDTLPLIEPIRQQVAEAIEKIEEGYKRRDAGGKTYSERIDPIAHLSKALRRTASLFAEGGALAREGNEIVERWWSSELAPPQTGGPSHQTTELTGGVALSIEADGDHDDL